MSRAVGLLSLLVCLCGCRAADKAAGPQAAAQTTAAPAATTVEVVTEPAAVQAARAHAQQQEAKALDAFFAQFGPRTFGDDDMYRRFRGRQEPHARLRAMRERGKDEDTRVRAAALLCIFGDDSCWSGYAALLSGSRALQASALQRMGGTDIDLPFPPPQILAAIVNHLDSPHRDVREAAVSACKHLGIPAAVPKLVAMLRQHGDEPKGYAAWAVSQDGPSVDAVKLTARLLTDPAQKDEPITLALMTFAGSDDPAVSRAAVAALVAHGARAGASKDDRSIAVEAIARYGSATYVSVLRAAAANDSHEGALALAGLIRNHDAGALEKGLALVEAKTAQMVVLDAVLRYGGDDARKRVLAAAANLARDDQAHVLWTIKGLTAADAAARLQELGVIRNVPPVEAQIRARRDAWGSHTREPWLLSSMLAQGGSVLSFDTESGFLPVPHDLLLHDLAAISGGRFAPSAVWQDWKNRQHDDDLDADYIVQFVANDRLYRFTAENLSDWYDVPAVLTAANRALADAGVNERFVSLYTGDQTAQIIFSDPAAAARAAGEFLITLEDDPDRSRRDGRAFEAIAIEELLKKQ